MTERRYCTLAGTKFRLPLWLSESERFSDQFLPVDPNLQFLPNDRSTLLARQASTFWQMNEWRAGEGFDRWEPEREGGGYYRSSNVRPKRVGDGLVLGPESEITQDSTGAADFADGARLGIGQGGLWVARQDNAYLWDESNGRWGSAVTTGHSTTGITTIADVGDSWMYSGDALSRIRRWKTGSNELHYATGTADDFTQDPVLAAFGERLFALDGDDLYEIDLTATDTRTLIVDVGGAGLEYIADLPYCYNRLSASDKGPIWFQRLDNGQTRIWEYNVAQDVGYIVGELPVSMSFPTDIYFARGFIFVAFKSSVAANALADVHIYFQRGAQRGVLGPIRAEGSKLSVAKMAGVLGDELIFYYAGAVWAYNLSSGGLIHVGSLDGDEFAQKTISATVFGPDIFVSALSGDKVQRFRTNDRYTTETATIDSGLYDLGYLDIPKKLVEVTVVTEPLPANTSVSVAYTTDGTTYTALTGAHETDGASEKTWIVSTSSATVRGRRFGIRLTLATTDPTVTPTVRGILVRGRTAAHERVIVARFDVSTDGDQDTAVLLAALRTMVGNQDVVVLSLPFEKAEGDTPETLDVEVRNVQLPDAETPESRPIATVEMAAVALVTA